MMDKYPDELTCDMVEEYGVFDIKRLPARLAATLAVGLRDNSRVKRAKTGTKYDDNTILLAYCADLLAWLKWSRTEDGINNVNQPDSILEVYLGKPKMAKGNKKMIVFESPEAFDRAWEGN